MIETGDNGMMMMMKVTDNDYRCPDAVEVTDQDIDRNNQKGDASLCHHCH